MTVLLDSSAWFEYFFGTEKGEKVREILASNEEIVVSQINLIEIYSKYLKNAPAEAEEKKNFLLSRSELIDVNKEISLAASKLKAEKNLALADAIIAATALKYGARIITTDQGYKNIKNSVIL